MSLRRPNKGETQKLVLFLALVFVLANLFALGLIRRHLQESSARLAQLHADLGYARTWLESKDLWEKRAAWLAEKQPKLEDPGQAGVALLESLQKLAVQDNLTIQEQTLKDPASNPHYREVSVHLVLAGSLESVCRWMTAVQQPESFEAVTNFSLKNDGDDMNKIRCDLTVARWYAPR